jgi:curved DNA-binding protein CbpA
LLTASDVNAAFRQLAKTAHPDGGGSDEDYRRIVEARDALLKNLARSG